MWSLGWGWGAGGPGCRGALGPGGRGLGSCWAAGGWGAVGGWGAAGGWGLGGCALLGWAAGLLVGWAAGGLGWAAGLGLGWGWAGLGWGAGWAKFWAGFAFAFQFFLAWAGVSGLGCRSGGWLGGARPRINWGVLEGAVSSGAWILGNWARIFSHTFNENSKLMKMQLKAKFAQFLFILLLRV